MDGDRFWLERKVCRIISWDPFVAVGVEEAYVTSESAVGLVRAS